MSDETPRPEGPTLRDRVRDLREAKGWTQAQLAARAKVERSTIQNIESGRVQRPNTLAHVAEALGVKVAELTGEPVDDADRLEVIEGMLEAALAELARLKQERRNFG
jgi:HTH-type transcriptional regulator/antitoxin HipB